MALALPIISKAEKEEVEIIEDTSIEVVSQDIVQETEEKAIKQDYIIWIIALILIFALIKLMPVRIKAIFRGKKKTYKKEPQNIIEGKRTLKL